MSKQRCLRSFTGIFLSPALPNVKKFIFDPHFLAFWKYIKKNGKSSKEYIVAIKRIIAETLNCLLYNIILMSKYVHIKKIVHLYIGTMINQWNAESESFFCTSDKISNTVIAIELDARHR